MPIGDETNIPPFGGDETNDPTTNIVSPTNGGTTYTLTEGIYTITDSSPMQDTTFSVTNGTLYIVPNKDTLTPVTQDKVLNSTSGNVNVSGTYVVNSGNTTVIQVSQTAVEVTKYPYVSDVTIAVVIPDTPTEVTPNPDPTTTPGTAITTPTGIGILSVTPLTPHVYKVHIAKEFIDTDNIVSMEDTLMNMLFASVEGNFLYLRKYIGGKVITLDNYPMVTSTEILNTEVIKLNKDNILLRYNDATITYYRSFTIFGHTLVLTKESSLPNATTDSWVDEVNNITFTNHKISKLIIKNVTYTPTSILDTFVYVGSPYSISKSKVIGDNKEITIAASSRVVVGDKIYIFTKDNNEVAIDHT